VIQLNHPRPREGELDDGSYFSHLGAAGVAYRPDQPLAASPNARLLEPTPGGTTRPIDFDAIEVINGEPYGQHPWELMRADWYSLLRQCTETRTGSRPAIAISPIPTPPTRNRVINGPVVPNRRPPSTAASRVSGVSAARRKAT
jgi:hypothetical protein